jgi:hypothetical protein
MLGLFTQFIGDQAMIVKGGVKIDHQGGERVDHFLGRLGLCFEGFAGAAGA